MSARHVMNRGIVQLGKRNVFLIVALISTVLLVLCALNPPFALTILFDFCLPVFGGLLILHAAWRSGRRQFELLILAILLALVGELIQRYAAGAVLSEASATVVGIVFQVGSLVCLIVTVFIWFKAGGFGDAEDKPMSR
jgi:hypothetical protein